MESESTQYHNLPLSSPSLIPITFHKLQSNFTFGISNYSPDKFRKVLTLLTEDKNLLYPHGPILITFDDGYAHLEALLPDLIQKFEFNPIMFIPTAHIGRDNRWDYSYLFCKERHLTINEIKSLSKSGVIFGSHGMTHRSFTTLPTTELATELSQSKLLLQDITGQTIDSISYPFGQYNQIVTNFVHKAGYTNGFSMKFPSGKDEPISRGRIPTYTFESANDLINKISRGRSGPGLVAISGLISFLSRGTTLYQKLSGSFRQND